ncbi:OadG family transporter subunit [Paraglaciecola sp.]|uniref:OadG family protein n=1 Tax=Paraglaciecola sp. TaxID=1920173 RepID=UPI0030F3F7E2
MHTDVTGLLLEAAYLMAVGMFVVFLFLGALIGAMTIVAWLNKKFSDTPSQSLQMQPQVGQFNHGLSSGVIAAITAAIHQHRNK